MFLPQKNPRNCRRLGYTAQKSGELFFVACAHAVTVIQNCLIVFSLHEQIYYFRKAESKRWKPKQRLRIKT